MICPKCNQFVPDTNYRCPHCRKVLKEGIDPLIFQEQPRQRQFQRMVFFIVAIVVIGVGVLGYYMFLKGGKENPNPDSAAPSRPPVARKDVTSQPQEGRNAGEVPPAKSPDSEATPDTDAGKENTGESTVEEIPVKADANEPGEKTDNPYDWVDKEDPEKLAASYVPGEEVDIEKLLRPGKTTIFDFYSEYCPPCRKISPALAALDNKREDIVVVKININRKDVQGIDWKSPVTIQYRLSSVPHFIIYDSTGYRTHEGEEAYQKVIDILTQEGINTQ